MTKILSIPWKKKLQVPPYQTLYAINGGLVGLGVDETVDILEDKSKGWVYKVPIVYCNKIVYERGLHSVARSLPRFLRDPPLIPCIGIGMATINDSCKFAEWIFLLQNKDLLFLLPLSSGLVRSIDPEKKLFYIITPEPSERLAQVNTLLKGNIEMPAQLIYQVHMHFNWLFQE